MTEIRRSQADLNALNGFLESLRSHHEFLVQIPPEDQLIYHYTDLGALSGIIGLHDLWLTNSQYSNDTDESKHGYEIARGEIAAYLRSAKRKRPKKQRKIDYATTLSSIFESTAMEGFYICCFCDADNLLSQWRSYGANGTGVSIAFDPMEFIQITGADMPLGLMRLWKVFYKKSRQKRIVKRAINYVWENHAGEQDVEKLARRAADAIKFFVPTFKNEDFREEKERRLIFTPDPHCSVKPQYRVGRGMLIPYYSIRGLAEAASRGTPSSPWPLPIRAITVGPTAQKELNVESVTMLLRQNDYTDVEVTASATPYRG